MATPTDRSAVSIAIFAYRRLGHLQRTVESLRANPEAAHLPLIVYCDAARDPAQRPAVDAVRAYARAITGFASLEVAERETNLGLAQSIIGGVTAVLERHERVIVVEDDLLLSPHFLRYMLDGLDRYAEDAQVASIHGYVYPVTDPLPETFFLKGADCWGWATWRRAWQHFRADGRALLVELEAAGLTREFDFDGGYPFTRMLRGQVAGRNDSWAIRWNASCFLAGMLTLYPGRSLVHNIGNDASGTHAEARDVFFQAVALQPVPVDRIPLTASESARSAFGRFLRSQTPSLWQRGQRLLRRLLRRRIAR
jgi:hypothetical protein